jgi:hypothetical protein
MRKFRMKLAGIVARMGENSKAGKPEGKRPRGRPKHRWMTLLMAVLNI